MKLCSAIRKVFFWPFQLYAWLVFFPILVLSTVVMGSLSILLVFTASPRIASMVGGVIWSRLIVYVSYISVKVSGRENIEPKQSYVIISNHQSQYDIPLLYGWIGVDFRWVMKKELRKIPFLGMACEKIGHIFVDRSNKSRAVESINSAKRVIRDGTSVLFFPEGTRTETGELGAFRTGAFRMAIDLQLPILPVVIAGTREILPSKRLFPFPGKAEMIIRQPIKIDGYSMSNVKELMEEARKSIESGLNR